MRWDALFTDLEAQGAAIEQAELAAEVAERTRGEIGGIGFVDRARAALGADLQLTVDGGVTIAGRLLRVGVDWLLLAESDLREALIATAQLTSVRGLDRAAAVPGSAGLVESRIGIRVLLRALARDRSAVRVHLTDGSMREATIERVGADFLDVITLRPAEPRPRAGGWELLPIAAVAAVRRSV